MPREEKAEGMLPTLADEHWTDLNRIEAISRDVRVMAVGEFILLWYHPSPANRSRRW
jgi:hypothetical protein